MQQPLLAVAAWHSTLAFRERGTVRSVDDDGVGLPSAEAARSKERRVSIEKRSTGARPPATLRLAVTPVGLAIDHTPS